jgi:hypothetical protein
MSRDMCNHLRQLDVYDLDECSYAEGLGRVLNRACVHETSPLAARRVGAHHDKGEYPLSGHRLQATEDLVIVRVRQVDIQEDEVEYVLPCELEADAALKRRQKPEVRTLDKMCSTSIRGSP